MDIPVRANFLGILALAFFVDRVAQADDGHGYGTGTAFHLGGKTRVRMAKETVLIQVENDSADVYCRFTFTNKGPAEDVLIGFPDSGGGEGASIPALTHFVSRVDGRRIATNTLGGDLKRASNKLDDSGDFSFYHVKRVHFAAHQTRIVEDWYQSKLGGSIPHLSHFEYVMQTGASWNGPIGSATVRIRMANHGNLRSKFRPHGEVNFSKYVNGMPKSLVAYHGFGQPSIHGNVITFRARKLTPDRDSDIQLTFEESR